MVKCEKCGAELDALEIGEFCRDGSDVRINVAIVEADKDAVVFETTPNWTDYELSEEERLDGVLCPHCKQFPFKNREIQVYDIVRCVCFKTEYRPGHGHWIYHRDRNGIKSCKCSECLTSYGCIDTPYCPNCGAKMDQEVEEE